MERVYLCLGKNAEVPYYFERARTHVWNVEELCYFLRENAWLLDPELPGKDLAEWVGQQCGLPDLAKALVETGKEENPVTGFVNALFLYTGYCSSEEIVQVEKILKLNESTGALERAAARGDYFLESGKFVLALQEYEELLKKLTGMEPAFRAKVYHNRGVAQARLFWFQKAADSFERAWKLTKNEASAQQYLAAKRMGMGEQEYVDFLALHPDFYHASLKLEEQMRECGLRWRESEDADFILHATEAIKDGAGDICSRMVEERVGPLQDAYRSLAVR